VLLSSGDSFPRLIQKRRSQHGFVTYLLNYPRTILVYPRNQSGLEGSSYLQVHKKRHFSYFTFRFSHSDSSKDDRQISHTSEIRCVSSLWTPFIQQFPGFYFWCFFDRTSFYNLNQWPTWCTNFNTFITILYIYMFRTVSCSSSGGQIVLTFWHRSFTFKF
jgi:hypothetical protein